MPPSRRFSSTVSSGTVDRPSGHERHAHADDVLGLVPGETVPSRVAVPDAGLTSPARVRMRVDLPAPFAPMTAVTSPRGTSRDTCDSAWTGP